MITIKARLIRAAAAACAALAILTPATGGFAADAALTARFAEDDGFELVEIGLSRPLAFEIHTRVDPPRVVVDFPALDWRAEAPRAGAGLDLIEGVRFGLIEGGAARMVVDLRAPARVDRAWTEAAAGAAAARFTLALAPQDAADFSAAARPAATARDPNLPPAPLPRPDRHVLIAIDPGHGGRDPGAEVDGLAEKDLVLDYAEALAARIDAEPGFRAILTRTDDAFLTLRQRVDIARAAGADAFISLHADALSQGVATGASVFTLSEEASDEEAAELAESINRADIIASAPVEAEETDVTRVLVDLARRDTDALSVELAAALVEALERRAPVLEGRALQSAGFRVLKAPDVPSALIELGFLSSARDRARLASPDGRAAIVAAVSEALFAWARAQTGPRFRPARAEAER